METRAADRTGRAFRTEPDAESRISDDLRDEQREGPPRQVRTDDLKGLLKRLGYRTSPEGKASNILTYVACLPDAAWIQRSGYPIGDRSILIRRIREEIPLAGHDEPTGNSRMTALHCAVSGNPDLSVELIDCLEDEFGYSVEDIDEIAWDCGMHLAHRIRYSGGYPDRSVVARIFRGRATVPPLQKEIRPGYWDDQSDSFWWSLLRYAGGGRLGRRTG